MLSQPGLRALNLQKVRLLDRLAAARPELAAELRGLKLDWYTIRNAVDNEESTDVFIYDEIGGSMGVDASTFVQELNAITTPEVVVRINSPGGLLIDGIAIANAFEQHTSHITTRVDSMAASAASIIFASGDTCETMPGSQVMVHDASVNLQANPAQILEMYDWLSAQSENVAGIYANKAGGTKAEWRARMQAETWMFADEALEIGIADRMYVSPKSQPAETETDSDPINSALRTLMNRKHRMTNRGYKYFGRDAAPSPEAQLASALKNALPQPLKNVDESALSAEEIDNLIAGFSTFLERK